MRVLSTHSIRQFPLHFPSRASPCATGFRTSSTCLIFLCPRTHASPQTCHHSASSVFADRNSCRVIAVFVFRKPLFTLILASQRTSGDAGSVSKPKRSRDVLFISEKVKILNMIGIEKKNPMQRLPDCMARTDLPFVK